MKKQILCIVFIIFYSIGCNPHHGVDKELYIIDQHVQSSEIVSTDRMTRANSRLEAFFSIEQDTIRINQWQKEFGTYYDTTLFNYKRTNQLEGYTKDSDYSDIIDIPIVTNQLTGYDTLTDAIVEDFKVILLDQSVSMEYPGKNNEHSLFSAYPVCILNMTDSIKVLDKVSMDWLYMVQQAKDIQGRWREVEFWHFEGACTSGLNPIEILPEMGIVTKTPKFMGDFETEIRVKLYTGGKLYYSNSIKGKVNKEQFNIPEEFNTLKESNLKNHLLTNFK